MGDLRKTTFTIAVCILVFSSILVKSEECPPPADIYPCSCGYLPIVYCKDLANATQFRSVVAGLKGYKISKLEVQDSNIGDVPGNLFQGTHMLSLRLINTTVTSLGDEKIPPFTGLENSLDSISIINEKLLTKPLRLGHLKALTYLYYGGLEIPTLGNDWFNEGPESLTWLSIHDCGIKQVGSEAFSRLINLENFEMLGNNFTVPRSALPKKVEDLRFITIWENGVKEIPKDFFKDMPALENVQIGYNSLSSIPQQTWETIWPQLSAISFVGNPLVCDSKLKWILNYNREDLSGECATPEKLKGKALSSLKEEDLK